MPLDTPPVALVTGAASGMGLALTKHLVSLGWKVGMCDINESLGRQESAAINNDNSTATTTHPAGGDRTFFRRVDITDYATHAAFFRDVFDWGGGRIDYLAANAGITEKHSLFKRAERMAVDDATGLPKPLEQKQIFDVNIKAVVDGIWLYRFFAARRRDRRRGGKITVTASTSGLYSYKGWPLYAASKHAMVGLVRSAAPSLKLEGIVINAVCPSFVKTGLPALPQLMLDSWPQEYLTPMETVLRAHDAFLNVDETGQTVETSHDKLYWRKAVEFADENARWVAQDSEEYVMKLKGLLPSKL